MAGAAPLLPGFLSVASAGCCCCFCGCAGTHSSHGSHSPAPLTAPSPRPTSGAKQREDFDHTIVHLYLQPEGGLILSAQELILKHEPIIEQQQLNTGKTKPQLFIGGSVHTDTIPAAVRKSGKAGNHFERVVMWDEDQIGGFSTTGKGCNDANAPFLQRMVVIPSDIVAAVKAMAAEAAAAAEEEG